jgi:hypothetical protein
LLFTTQVCLGDRIIIDIQNNIAGGQMAIHWHGVFQRGTQYMDGVPMITQCSIHEGDVFRYDFLANNEGTHYWHSHDGKYCSSRSECWGVPGQDVGEDIWTIEGCSDGRMEKIL